MTEEDRELVKSTFMRMYNINRLYTMNQGIRKDTATVIADLYERNVLNTLETLWPVQHIFLLADMTERFIRTKKAKEAHIDIEKYNPSNGSALLMYMYEKWKDTVYHYLQFRYTPTDYKQLII